MAEGCAGRRRSVGAGVLVVLGLCGVLTAGCGTPSAAEPEAFCEALAPDTALESYPDLEEWRAEWSATGTPDGISATEREGFETLLDKMDGIAEEDWDGADTLSRMSMDSEEQEKARAFSEYLTRACPEEAAQVATKLNA